MSLETAAMFRLVHTEQGITGILKARRGNCFNFRCKYGSDKKLWTNQVPSPGPNHLNGTADSC